MKFLKLFASLIFVISFINTAQATERGTRQEAIALVKNAIVFLKENGKEKAFAAINDQKGAFVKGDLYLFVYSTNGDGINLAHGQNPKLIGKQLLEMRDVDGVYLIKEFIATANSKAGNGWVDYKWPNNVTKAVEQKSTYVEKVGDVLIGCGIYK